MASRTRNVKTLRTVKDIRKAVQLWRKAGEPVALVPTMGALHNGHLTLVRAAQAKAKRVVVSIFVNPTQFAPTEDLARYPRDEAGDLAKLASVGADLVWAPEPAEMYPEGYATMIDVKGAALGLEGEFRPHHFGGVATVCCKLFSQVTPDYALFGEKDFQQLAVVRQMVRDLNLPLAIVGVPTVREADGLALSSRNRYLGPEERAIAPALNAALLTVAEKIAGGGRAGVAVKSAITAVERAGFTKVDYIAVRDAETLGEWKPSSGRPGRVLAAAWLGRTRLIDNVPIAAVKS
ncbi:MAG: pantoate--beta-alanine ligase [Hyphomicrobiaceae bacterium]|nr:pantoate--beta-alanine ligase [Hyphomicrobiaceae bacterium]